MWRGWLKGCEKEESTMEGMGLRGCLVNESGKRTQKTERRDVFATKAAIFTTVAT